MEVLSTTRKLDKIVYQVKLSDKEKYFSDSQIINLLDDIDGFGYTVKKFEDTATITIYLD